MYEKRRRSAALLANSSWEDIIAFLTVHEWTIHAQTFAPHDLAKSHPSALPLVSVKREPSKM
jgi:hypothetical protein